MRIACLCVATFGLVLLVGVASIYRVAKRVNLKTKAVSSDLYYYAISQDVLIISNNESNADGHQSGKQNSTNTVKHSANQIIPNNNNNTASDKQLEILKKKKIAVAKVVEAQLDCFFDGDIRNKPLPKNDDASKENGEWIFNKTAMRINTTATWKRNVRGCSSKRLRGYWQSEKDDEKFPHIFYKWRPKTKCLHSYKTLHSMDELCDLINGRNVFFFGDSVLRNLFDLFKFAFGIHEEQGYKYPNGLIVQACERQNKPFELRYEFTKRFIKEVEVDALLSVLNRTQDGIFLLNTGRHYREDKLFTKDIQQTFKLLDLYSRRHSFFYWSTLDAFLPLWNQTVPQTRMEFEKEKTKLDLVKPDYSYVEFDKQTEIVRRFIHGEYREIIFLDTREPLKYRSDSRGDPVHWCMPGALDNMVEWLFNAIAASDYHRMRLNLSES